MPSTRNSTCPMERAAPISRRRWTAMSSAARCMLDFSSDRVSRLTGRVQRGLLDHLQYCLAIHGGWLHGADVVVHGRQNGMCRHSEIFADPNGGLIVKNCVLDSGIVGGLEMNQKTASEFRGLPLIEVFRLPVVVGGRFVHVEIASS